MAKLLLTCDEYVYCYKGKYYASSQERYDFYQRYLRVFEKIRLVTRCIDEIELKKSRVCLDDPRIEYIPIPFYRGPKEYFQSYFSIAKILKNITEGCDAAVLRLPASISSRVANYVMRNNLPYATEIVYDAKDGYNSSDNLLTKLIWMKIDHDMKNICFKAEGVSCVTQFHLQKRYFSKKAGSFSGYYSSLALDSGFYGICRSYPRNRRFIISHVANQIEFNGRKGHKELIMAVAKLKAMGLQVEVQFAGQDYLGGIPKFQRIIKQLDIEDQIKFVGYLSRNELDTFLESSDLFVLPTKAEGLPRVIIEAMAKGLPCISTNVSGNPELLESRFLVDYSDVDSLAKCIKDIIESETLYEQTSKRNLLESRKYEASILEKRRDSFYKNLKSKIKL